MPALNRFQFQLKCVINIQNRPQMFKGKNKKVDWCEDEDKFLINFVSKEGTKKWSVIAKELFDCFGDSRKTGKHCRQRWVNHLDPKVVKNQWTQHQEQILFDEHKKYGNRWTLIAQKLQGRSDNSIKNHFYSLVRKYLRRINKILGNKNSTAKIRKIKPSALSKVFSLNEQQQTIENQFKGCLDLEDNYQKYQKQRELVYNLINLSRNKLSDNINLISQQDMQMFQKLIQQIYKINQTYQKLKGQQLRLKNQNEDSQFSEYAQPVCLKRNSKKSVLNKQSTRQIANLNNLFATKLKKIQSQPVSIKKIDQNWCQDNKQNLAKSHHFNNDQSQQTISPTEKKQANQFDFSLDLDQNVPELNYRDCSPWIRMTPNIFTPPFNQMIRFRTFDSLIKQEDINNFAEQLRTEIKGNTNKRSKEYQNVKLQKFGLFCFPSPNFQF